jgi:hypothetical protein
MSPVFPHEVNEDEVDRLAAAAEISPAIAAELEAATKEAVLLLERLQACGRILITRRDNGMIGAELLDRSLH